jgi:hypothetical protein
MVTEAEARRIRPFMSGMVALAVTLVAAIGWYYAGRPDESVQPVKTVDWAAWVKAGRADDALKLYAPDALPEGWRATTATYVGGNDASWRLGLLTDTGRFVGLEETYESADDVVERVVDENAVQGEDVIIDGVTWQTWTDAGGDYAVALDLTVPGGRSESVVVAGR